MRAAQRRRWGGRVGAALARMVGLYQALTRGWMAPRCRFRPSCSVFAREALSTLSLPSALAQVAWRLARCQPLCRGGHDPVPTAPARRLGGSAE